MLFNILVTVSIFVLVNSSASNCKTQYIDGLSVVLNNDKRIMFDLLSTKSFGNFQTYNVTPIFHIGPQNSAGRISITMNQLNVSTISPGKVHSHCHTVDHIGSQEHVKSMLYFGNLPTLRQWEVAIGSFKKPLFILSDIEDIGAFVGNNRTANKLFVLPFVTDNLINSEFWNDIQESNDFAKANAVWDLYKQLVKCIIPAEALLVLGTSTSNSQKYWTDVTNFLAIHPSTTSRTGHSLSVAAFNHIVAGGVPNIKNGHCYLSDNACTYTKSKAGEQLIVPSVCASAINVHQVQVTNSNVKRCATEYVGELATIFGEKYRTIMLNRLLMPEVFTLPDTKAQIVLNIGPGSSGTRSLYLAMQMLNVTASHYRLFSQNCSSFYWNHSRVAYDNKQLTHDHKIVFWGDTPVLQRWWRMLNYYNSDQMYYIMTDMNSDKWLEARRFHCTSDNPSLDCYIPSPIPFYPFNEIELQNVLLQKELASLASIRNVKHAALHVKSFESYRNLVRCIIPKDKLLWINFNEVKDSLLFWSQLINFMHLNASDVVLKKFANVGIPYIGKKGCFIGHNSCEYVGEKDVKVEGGLWTSAVVPSVCASA